MDDAGVLTSWNNTHGNECERNKGKEDLKQKDFIKEYERSEIRY